MVIYYAGHGKNDPDAKVAYWLPVDAHPVNSSNWISSDDITAELRVIKADHILIIADSCFAGATLRDATATGDLRAEINPQQMTYYLAKLEHIRSRDFMGDSRSSDSGSGAAPDDPQEQIQQIIEQYRLAYNNRDLEALRKLWPDMNPQVSKNLQQFFRTASSISITCTLLRPPAIQNNTASLDINEEIQFSTNGRPQKINPQRPECF